jgi:hypothetical protein
MPEVEPQGPVNVAPPKNTVSGPANTSSQLGPHGKHEVAPEKPTEDTQVANYVPPAQENGDRKPNGTEHLQSDDIPAIDNAVDPPADEGKKEEPAPTTSFEKPKPAMSVKTTGGKSLGPPTPLVKRVSPVGQILPLP